MPLFYSTPRSERVYVAAQDDCMDAAAHLNSPAYAALAWAVHQRGVMVHPSNIEPWFVSMVHTLADIDRTLDAFEDALGATRSPLLAASA